LDQEIRRARGRAGCGRKRARRDRLRCRRGCAGEHIAAVDQRLRTGRLAADRIARLLDGLADELRLRLAALCDTDGGACAPISGATSRQYTATSADVSHRLRVTVTATNSSGSGMATSRATNIVAATGQAPKNTSAPAISGTVKEGSTLTVDKGGWTGTNPITYAYAWQRCDATGGNCANIAGATSNDLRRHLG